VCRRGEAKRRRWHRLGHFDVCRCETNSAKINLRASVVPISASPSGLAAALDPREATLLPRTRPSSSARRPFEGETQLSRHPTAAPTAPPSRAARQQRCPFHMKGPTAQFEVQLNSSTTKDPTSHNWRFTVIRVSPSTPTHRRSTWRMTRWKRVNSRGAEA